MSFKFESWNEYLKFFLTLIAALSFIFTAIGYSAAKLTDIASIPERLEAVEISVDQTNLLLRGFRPEIVDFRGVGIVADNQIFAGDTITVTYTLRRNVACETDIRVNFYNHDTNSMSAQYSYTIPAIRSPVSKDYSHFPVEIRIPEDLPEGIYSYAPLIIPLDCGVYGTLTVPLSESFYVQNPNQEN